MSDDTKVCPKCAETVRAEAKVCRHCGHTFGAVDESVPSSAPKKGGFLKRGLGCLGIALVVLLLIGVFAPDPATDDANRSDNTAAANVPERTSATDDTVEPNAATDGSTPGLTAANFERIRDGMTPEQVSDLLGSPGEKVSETSFGGTTATNYQWTGGMLSGRVVVGTFTDGKLVGKTQTGL